MCKRAEAERLKARACHPETHVCRKQMRTLPSRDPQEPGYQRLGYVPYADNVLLGFPGLWLEAAAFQRQLGPFLRELLHLTRSEEKTLITHGRTEAARFLGYDTMVFHADHKLDKIGRREVYGKIGLCVPRDVVQAKSQPYKRHRKPIPRAELAHGTVFWIAAHCQQGYRGPVRYYRMSYDRIAGKPEGDRL